MKSITKAWSHSALPRRHELSRFSLAMGVLTLFVSSASGQVSVSTEHNDNSRTGQNLSETYLTPTTVVSKFFGKMFTQNVDGIVAAQPLYIPGVAIPGAGTHNVVYVVTQHDSVYAFDADNNAGANAAPLWAVSFLNPGAGI